MRLPVEQSCYWLASRTGYVPEPALTRDCDADFAIVGGGFTGLWTAYFLNQLAPSARIVVIEKSVTGYGASGRNAGIVSTSLDHSHALAIDHFGKDEAARLVQIGLNNIDELEQYATGCDFERTGQLQICLTPAHIEDCKHNLEVAKDLGLTGYKLLSADETRSEVNSPLYLGALFVPGGGILNPIKLIDKIKKDLLARGVVIYENTAVKRLDGARIICEHGQVNAAKVMVATDAYTHHLLPGLLWRFIPLYDYIMVSEPLDARQKEAIRWRHRQAMVDGRTFFNYYRLTADDRVLWGTSEAKYYPPNLVDESCDHSQEHYDALRASFASHFPQVGPIDFPYYWGGPIASTTRLTPFFGTTAGGRVIYGLGYTGHGIGTTRIAGKIMAHMATAKPSELLSLKLVTDKPFPYPPEPLRALSVNMVTSSLRKVDAGESPNLLLKLLDALHIGFSS